MFPADRPTERRSTAINGVNIRCLLKVLVHCGRLLFDAYLGAVHRMKTLEKFLKPGAQLIEERCLACPDCISTAFGSADHTQHGVRRGIDLK